MVIAGIEGISRTLAYGLDVGFWAWVFHLGLFPRLLAREHIFCTYSTRVRLAQTFWRLVMAKDVRLGTELPVGHGRAQTLSEVSAGQRAVLIRIIRLVFVILIVTFTTLAFYQAWAISQETNLNYWVPIVAAALVIVIVVGIDVLTPVKRVSSIAGVLLGLLVGILATLVVSALFDLLLQSWTPERAYAEWRPTIQSIKILVGICFGYLGVVTVLQTQDDFRLVIPYVEFAKQIRGVRPVILDTSALIDGRIADIAGTGFLQMPMLIPNFVVHELQVLADSGDSLRRARGRRGLDMITRLQRNAPVDVSIDETPIAGAAVDQMLIELARGMPAMVLTGDVGLARVAAIQGVTALNLNDLANAAKVNLTPGEMIDVRVLRAGEQAGQGVGFLPDGTMIVIEDGGGAIGENVQAVVTSSLQTSAGRLIFAKIGLEDAGDASQVRDAGAEVCVVIAAEQGSAAGVIEGDLPHAAASGSAESGAAAGQASQESAAAQQPRAARSPFPPKPPAAQSMKHGTPRNPRR